MGHASGAIVGPRVLFWAALSAPEPQSKIDQQVPNKFPGIRSLQGSQEVAPEGANGPVFYCFFAIVFSHTKEGSLEPAICNLIALLNSGNQEVE